MLERLVSFNWDQGSSWLQCSDSWYWTEDIRCLIRLFWSARNRTEYLSNNTSWYIIDPSLFRTKYLPPAYHIGMEDQYGLTAEDYVYDLNILSDKRYGQGMLFLILSFLKQRLKPFQAIAATLMLYDFIYHIPRQVRLSICTQWFHISLLGSVSPQVCFPFNGRLLPLMSKISEGSGQNYMSSIFLSW